MIKPVAYKYKQEILDIIAKIFKKDIDIVDYRQYNSVK